jgi:hypothetical protein
VERRSQLPPPCQRIICGEAERAKEKLWRRIPPFVGVPTCNEPVAPLNYVQEGRHGRKCPFRFVAVRTGVAMTSEISNWIGAAFFSLWFVGWLTGFFIRFRFRKHRSILASTMLSVILTLVMFWISVGISDIADALQRSESSFNRALSVYLWGLAVTAPFLILIEWAVGALLKKRGAVQSNRTG